MLPIEIIGVIGTFLLPPPGLWSYSDGSRDRFGSLLSLSSACRKYRWELAPLLWKEVTIFDESHLEKLLEEVMSYYSGSYYRVERVLRFPLTLMRSIRIEDCVLPDVLGHAVISAPIESVSWFVKDDHKHCSQDCNREFTSFTPHGSDIWRLFGPNVRQVDLGFYPDVNFSEMLITGCLESIRCTTHVKPGLFGGASDLWYEVLRNEQDLYSEFGGPKPRLKRVSILHDSVEVFKLDPQDVEGDYVKPPAFEEIEMAPMGPTHDLAEALVAYSHTLRRLTLKFDTSRTNFFTDFDRLFANLSVPDSQGAVFPVLKSINIEPLPQQNTAPSFFTFIEACPALEEVNGRKNGTFPPCLGLFSPDTPSGALPY